MLIPHPRYLIDYAPLPASFAATLMCSGLTAYAALKRLAAQAALGPLLLVGMGGVGMMGLALARAMFAHAPLVADVDGNKRAAALAAGAAAAFDPNDAGRAQGAARGDRRRGLRRLRFRRLGPFARVRDRRARQGRQGLVTGLFGGTFTMPVAMFALKAIAIEGIQTGTLAEARELIALARDRKLRAPPIGERPLGEAQAALDALRAGRVVGRTVLTA